MPEKLSISRSNNLLFRASANIRPTTSLLFGITCLVTSLLTQPVSHASVHAYLRSTVGQPWGVSTNEAAMTSAFGAGNWDDLRFETANTASLFSPATKFIFLEGSDNNADELELFLGNNSSTISNWVNSGGSLFINAAPNEGNGMNFGFGVTLSYPDFGGAGVANASNPLHPVFSGPSTPVSLAYTGNSFSHATVADGISFNPILVNGNGQTVLGELSVGAGHVLFGGMTTTNWHSPQPQAFNLRVNILTYGASQAQSPDGTVPEPVSFAIWSSLALASFGLAYRRRKA